MPRSAFTVARTHKGEWRVLATPAVSLIAQAKAFREMGGQRHHAEFAEVRYQETDGPARILYLRSPEQQEAHEKLRKAELDAAKRAGEKSRKEAVPTTGQRPEEKTEGKKENPEEKIEGASETPPETPPAEPPAGDAPQKPEKPAEAPKPVTKKARAM